MDRRKFSKLSAFGVVGLSEYGRFSNSFVKNKAYKYNLDYAPHLDMFKNLAGEDPIDQLNFIADLGFKSFEDNDMRKREISLQELMAKTMQKRGIRMGVFVAHEIYWKRPNLASGDKALQSEFLNYIKNDATFLEKEPLENIAKKGQLMAFKHDGFWQCMDTKRDKDRLEEILKK